MKKSENWDSTQAYTGEFKNITPGGHICKIVQAKQDFTDDGRELLIILFDIAEGEFKDFYKDQFDIKKAANAEAKWQGIYRQLTEGKSEPFYKGLITCIENSNPGYKWNFDENTLKGKLFGGVFGQEEYLNDKGETKLSTKCRFIRSVEAVRKGVQVPEIKKLQEAGGNTTTTTATTNQSAFGKDVFPDEEIPF